MTATGTDIVGLDRLAVHEAMRVVDLAKDSDWQRDTPCAGWDLRRLVAHMTAQHHGFAAAARGAGQEASHWREPQDMSDPARAHREAAAVVLDAFAEPGVMEREFAIPELGRDFPGVQAVAFHFIDYVVHAWDVAAALGVDLQLSDEVRGAAQAIARLVPAEPEDRAPGSVFAPALEVPDGCGPLEEALLLLGRSPESSRVG
ncbi:TIGR03086 family metal-binding protein [Streptomyces pratensis]|uniref:TIGR03086 family metal-binding protein n=1 Tax=Streptomyces pratensis TaxID=1169025 RepID=UPI003018F674